MKTKINNIYLASVLGMVLFVISSCNPAQPKGEPKSNKIEYSKDAVVPRYTDIKLGIYTPSGNKGLTADQCKEVLKKLSALSSSKEVFELNTEMKSDDKIFYLNKKDPSTIISFNTRNGDINFNAGMAKYSKNIATPDLLKGDKITEKARDYIKRLEIPIVEEEMQVSHVGGVNMGTALDGKSEVFEKFTTVRFDRQLDKVPVLGRSRIVVQLAEAGILNSFVSQWIPLQKSESRMEDLVSPDSVKAVLEKAVLSENEGATKIIIESMKLVYYDKGGEVIEPAIHVQGKTVHATKDAEGKTKEDTFPYDTVIPLLKSSRMKFPYDHSGLDKKADAGDNANNATEIKKSEDEVDKR